MKPHVILAAALLCCLAPSTGILYRAAALWHASASQRGVRDGTDRGHRHRSAYLPGCKGHLKKGANTLAVYSNVRYEQDAQTMTYHPVGQMDLFLEGLKKQELGLTR